MLSYRVFVIAATSVLCGCGLHVKPMPDRLSVEYQQLFDQGWLQLVSSMDGANRTSLLDAVLLRSAWVRGVERLQLVSEKQVGDVTVVMETWFERDVPGGDSFTLTFLAEDGTLLREESYTPAELDESVKALMTAVAERANGASVLNQPEKECDLEAQARLDAAEELFPLPEFEEEPAEGDAPVEAEQAEMG